MILISIVADMRNYYEYHEVGHFDKAIEVPSDTFCEQLPMRCVRCWMNGKIKISSCTVQVVSAAKKPALIYCIVGSKMYFILEGGIINYANIVKEQGLPNKFKR